MTLQEREAYRFKRFLSLYMRHLRDIARQSWEQGEDAGELDDEDREEIRRYLIERVIKAGGGSHALTLLHSALRAAEGEVAQVGPQWVDWEPEDVTEWYETEGGYAVAGGEILNENAYEYLDRWYEQAWLEGLDPLLRVMACADLQTAKSPGLTALVMALVQAANRQAFPPLTDFGTEADKYLRHESIGSSVVPTGPPAPDLGISPQVLTAGRLISS